MFYGNVTCSNITISNFWFRDEWFEDGYHDCFYDWYHNGCKETPYDLNQMVFEILEEWKERGYKRYRPAMDSIRDWCSRKWNKFESEHQAEVSAAYDIDEEKYLASNRVSVGNYNHGS